MYQCSPPHTIIIYYLINLILLILFSKYDIKINEKLPSLIYKELDELKSIANTVTYLKIVKLYIFEIILFSIMLFF